MASEINPANLLVQMRALAARAEGEVQARAADGAQFTDLLRTAVDRVNSAQQEAGRMTAAFDRGEDVALADVMVAMQKASVGFQATVQVRNRLVSAYQDIMNMPI